MSRYQRYKAVKITNINMYNDFQYSNSTLFSINIKKKIYQIQIKLYFKLRATPTHNNKKKGKWKRQHREKT